MRIGHVDLANKVLIVAEIGNNHEGDFDTAQELVRRAAATGVDAVKFQTYRTQQFVSRMDSARYDQLAAFELSYAQFQALRDLAKSLGLLFLSTPMDLESAAFLESLVDCYKIASADRGFYPLLEVVSRTDKPVILSSGLSTLDQIAGSVRFLEERWRERGHVPQLAVLHCVTSYPAPPEELNLAAISLLRERLGCPIGYSDHTIGIEACVVAVAAGARIIEKHFTLDKAYSSFRDHQLSADPPEMRELVHRVARVGVLLGRPEKQVQRSESALAQRVGRSIVAKVDLSNGHRLDWQDLAWTRPAVGLSPGEEGKLLGKRLKRAVSLGEPIMVDDVE